MTSESKTWETLKANYLRQVEKALSSVNHPRTKDIFEDVTSHLDQRFDELEPDQQTWENFQAIITEMGPASDYAELLAPDVTSPDQAVRRKYLLWVGLAAVVIITVAIILPMAISPKVGYIVSFKPVAPFQPKTTRQLLDLFDNRHADGVRTHHFKTEVRGDNLIGHICVDTAEHRNSLVKRLKENEKLTLVRARAVTQRQLESHYRRGQPSLKHLIKTYIVSFKRPISFVPDTARALLDAFNANHPRGVHSHHFRTEVQGNSLIGHICIDGESGKDAVISMLEESEDLVLVSAKVASEQDLEKPGARARTG